jgi:bifunctional UDP-N-acetylglucosamine pyrophosphorylase/glucosamine-1-phosphate N-acetyltransferase
MLSDRPTVVHRLAGKPLEEHVLDAAKELAPDTLCVVYGHGGDALPVAFGDEVAWARQEPQLGTGHAVRQALPQLRLSGVVLVLYGDVPLIRAETLHPLVELAKKDSLAILTVELVEPRGYGRILRNAVGKVTGIVEEKDADDSQRRIREVNTGIMAMPAERLHHWLAALRNDNAQKEYYLTDIVAAAARDGTHIATHRASHEWEVMGVNSKAQLARLERHHQENLAARLMDQGVTLRDPARLDVRGKLTCGRDVEIDVNCIFEGHVELEDGVVIGPHCVLRNVTVRQGAKIEAFTHAENAEIGPDGRVGPYARLRPGTVLAAAAHIGNFVEIKNSAIGEGSKVNHLSYIGDTDMGRQVNVGAGTITCNYDGANKHRTVIEDDAFIGSDSQLIAPVTVRRGATIGAGSTITREAPAGELTLARAKQVTLPGWKRPVKRKG